MGVTFITNNWNHSMYNARERFDFNLFIFEIYGFRASSCASYVIPCVSFGSCVQFYQV